MALTAVAAGVAAGGAYKSASAQKKSLKSQAWADENNARVAEYQRSQAIQDGQAQEEQSRLQTGALYGRERAELGASGVDLGFGSATDILTTTKLMGEKDAATIHDNALRTAWGYENTANNFTNQSKLDSAAAASISPWMSAATSLLGSASRYGYRTNTTGYNTGNSYYGTNGSRYANNDLSGTNRGSGD